MKPEDNRTSQRGRKLCQLQGEGPNWVFIVGGALLSTLAIRVGWRLKQVLDRKQSDNARGNLTGNREAGAKNRSGAQTLHRNNYIAQDGSSCHSCLTGGVEIKRATSRSVSDEERPLPLAMVPAVESSKDNSGEMWMSSPERLGLPQRPFHHSNSSDSLRLSESGSDIFIKRDVIRKLRQQLKRRDEMIMEMQAQLRELQNSLSTQIAHYSHLQSQLDSANKDLFDSEREIQRLRMAIAEHSVAEIASPKKAASSPGWHPEMNGHSNGYLDSVNALDLRCVGMDKVGRDGEKIEMLRREVQELKEVIEGKEFLLQSYKEHKTELTTKVKELQQRLNCQVPSIL